MPKPKEQIDDSGGTANLNNHLRNIALRRISANKKKDEKEVSDNPPDGSIVSHDCVTKMQNVITSGKKENSSGKSPKRSLKKSVKGLMLARRFSDGLTSSFDKGGKAFEREQLRTVGLTLDNRVNILNKIPALQMVSLAQRKAFAENLKSRTYARGETIVQEGDKGEEFYIIEHGSAVVTRRSVGGGEDELATLFENDFFGEIALLVNAPRTATVRAKLKCTCLYASKVEFERLISPEVFEEISEEEKHLQYMVMNKVPLFQELSKLERRKILGVMGRSRYKTGEYICKKDEIGNAMYIVLSGQVEVLIPIPDQVDKVVYTYGVGDFFGELALVNEDSKRTAHCRCLCDVEVLYLHRLHFSGYPTLARAVGIKNLFMNFGSRRIDAGEQDENGDAQIEAQEARREAAAEAAENDEDVNEVDFSGNPKLSIFDVINKKQGKKRKKPSLLRTLIRQKITVSENSMAKDFFLMIHDEPDRLDNLPKLNAAVDWLSKKNATRKINAYVIKALVTPADEKTDEDVHLLYEITRRQKFWNTLAPDATVQQQKALCRHGMKYFKPRINRLNEHLYSQGDASKTMFVCLSGSVSLKRTEMTHHQQRVKEVAVVTPGHSFGELALMGMTQRTENAIILEPSEFIEIHLDDYSKHLKSSAGLTVEEKFQLLKSCSVFASWDPYKLFRLSIYFEALEFPAGKIIYREGSRSKGLYILRSGEVAFVAKTDNANDDTDAKDHEHRFLDTPTKSSTTKFMKNNTIVSTITTGEFLGESLALQILVAGNKRYQHSIPLTFNEPVTAITTTPTNVLVLAERFIKKIQGTAVEVMRGQWEMKNKWRIDQQMKASEMKDIISCSLEAQKKIALADEKLNIVLQKQGISKGELLINNMSVIIKQYDVTASKMEKICLKKQREGDTQSSFVASSERKKKLLKAREEVFFTDPVNVEKDTLEFRERRREMILRSLKGSSAQKNMRRKKCVAYVKPLPERRRMPPLIKPTDNVDQYKEFCSPITISSSKLPEITQRKFELFGVDGSDRDIVGTLTSDRDYSSVMIDVFELQHSEKWDREKLMKARDLRLKKHRSDPSLSKDTRAGIAHLCNKASENVEWIDKRLRKGSEAVNCNVPSWIPLNKLVMDRYKNQMDKLFMAAKMSTELPSDEH